WNVDAPPCQTIRPVDSGRPRPGPRRPPPRTTHGSTPPPLSTSATPAVRQRSYLRGKFPQLGAAGPPILHAPRVRRAKFPVRRPADGASFPELERAPPAVELVREDDLVALRAVHVAGADALEEALLGRAERDVRVGRTAAGEARGVLVREGA